MTLLALLRWFGIALAVSSAIWVLDRGLLAMEARGWIYYRRTRASSGTLSSAFLSIQSIVQPGDCHVVEEIRRDETAHDDGGDPPRPGAPTT